MQKELQQACSQLQTLRESYAMQMQQMDRVNTDLRMSNADMKQKLELFSGEIKKSQMLLTQRESEHQ